VLSRDGSESQVRDGRKNKTETVATGHSQPDLFSSHEAGYGSFSMKRVHSP